MVTADLDLFRRVISNLLYNALKFSGRGGKVIISARQEDDLSVTIEVSDTGCGISPEHLPRIFDRFYRGDAAMKNPPAGSGLGLAIVRAIMTMHGGTVEAQSQVGIGTTMTLRFPQLPVREFN
jgi:two-component system heavy metal sensor histidine kinase CusS